MAGVRFTSWLAPRELVGLRRLAAHNGTSVNYILRIAVRRLLELPNTPALVTPPKSEPCSGPPEPVKLSALDP